jgi:hypothetical protein
LEQVAMPPVAEIEGDSIACKQSPHHGCKGRLAGSQQKVRMVRHERPAQTKGLCLGDNVVQPLDKIVPVFVIIEYPLSLNPPNHYMMQSTCCVNSRFPWHNKDITSFFKNKKL